MGLTASALVVLLATAVPWALGPVRFDPALAVNVVTAVAIIMTAAFAAENLLELRRAREWELTPIISPLVETRRRAGSDPQLRVTVRNIGHGAAVELSVDVWWPDLEQHLWSPHRLELPSDLLRADGELGGEVDFPWMEAAIARSRATAPTVVLEIRYRGAMGRPNVERLPYDLELGHSVAGTLIRSRHRPPSDMGSTRRKEEVLQAELDKLAEETGLTSVGVSFTARIEDGQAVIVVAGRDGKLSLVSLSAEQSVFNMVDWVRDDVPKWLAKAGAGPGDDRALS